MKDRKYLFSEFGTKQLINYKDCSQYNSDSYRNSGSFQCNFFADNSEENRREDRNHKISSNCLQIFI